MPHTDVKLSHCHTFTDQKGAADTYSLRWEKGAKWGLALSLQYTLCNFLIPAGVFGILCVTAGDFEDSMQAEFQTTSCFLCCWCLDHFSRIEKKEV